MGKSNSTHIFWKIAMFVTILISGITVTTSIHAIADLQEHFLHLAIMGGLVLLFMSYLVKDRIKITNRFAVVLLILLTFSIIRVFPCHVLSSNPQDLAHARVIDHPCSSAATNTATEVATAPLTEYVAPLEQLPHLAQLPLYINHLSNKSPPLAS